MKTASILICVILLITAFGSLALADRGNSHSQRGGLPALAARVAVLEGKVATLISQVATLISNVASLQNDVAALKSAVATLQNSLSSLSNTVANLGTAVTDLQGQNNFAVVSAAGTVMRHSGSDTVTGTKTATGTYNIVFKKDVSKCAYTATIGDPGNAAASTPGFITVTAGTASAPNDVQVQTFDKTGAAADASFHLSVSCP
ncbi:MAG TPA: hypothetical protein VFN26_15360 [Candidatus Acidoferrum sp.]|nr:hypothetical protein [Candidatus Acidoferrum sp.]